MSKDAPQAVASANGLLRALCSCLTDEHSLIVGFVSVGVERSPHLKRPVRMTTGCDSGKAERHILLSCAHPHHIRVHRDEIVDILPPRQPDRRRRR